MRIKREGWWYVLVEIDREWRYVADTTYTGIIETTSYASLAKVFYTQDSALAERKKWLARKIEAKTMRGYFK